MNNKYYQNRLNTGNRTTNKSQILPNKKEKDNNYKFVYSSKSPGYSSTIKYEKEVQTNNSRFLQYSHLKNSSIDTNFQKVASRNNFIENKCKRYIERKDPSHEKSFQVQDNSNHNFYISDYMKHSKEKAKIYLNKSISNLKSPTQMKLNEKYFSKKIDNIKNYTINNNINYNSNNKNRYNNTDINKNCYYKDRNITHETNLRYEREKEKEKNINEPKKKKEYSNKSYQGNKIPPKYYRNNQLIKPKKESNTQKNKNIKYESFPLRLIAQKICNIYIRRNYKANKNKNKKHLSKKKKNIYEEEETLDNANNYYNNEEELDFEGSYNYETTPIISEITMQKTLNIKPKKKKSNSTKNKKSRLKIQKMKNPHIELKKIADQTIKMQKAQSFIQPRDFNYTSSRPKNKKMNYEVTQLKDCDGELIERTFLTIKKKSINEYDNPKTNINIRQARKEDSDLSIIPRPELNKSNISNDNSYYSKNKKISMPVTIVMNKRSRSNIRLKEDSIQKKDEQIQNGKYISNRNNNSLISNISSLNSNLNKKQNEIEKENISELSNKVRNNIKTIQYSSNNQINTNLNKNETINYNSKRKNHTTLFSSSVNNRERSKSYQKINYEIIDSTTNINNNKTNIISSNTSNNLPKDKIRDIKEKENDKNRLNTNININSNTSKHYYDEQNKEKNKKYTINILTTKSKNILEECNNNNQIINEQHKTQMNIKNSRYDKKENEIKYSFTNKYNKENKEEKENIKETNENQENKEIKKKKEMIPINNHKSHTITIIPNLKRNDLRRDERIYFSKGNQKAKSIDKNSEENKDQSNVGISHISNINNNKSFEIGKRDIKSESFAKKEEHKQNRSNIYSSSTNNRNCDNYAIKTENEEESKYNNNNKSCYIYISKYSKKNNKEEKKDDKNEIKEKDTSIGNNNMNTIYFSSYTKKDEKNEKKVEKKSIIAQQKYNSKVYISSYTASTLNRNNNEKTEKSAIEIKPINNNNRVYIGIRDSKKENEKEKLNNNNIIYISSKLNSNIEKKEERNQGNNNNKKGVLLSALNDTPKSYRYEEPTESQPFSNNNNTNILKKLSKNELNSNISAITINTRTNMTTNSNITKEKDKKQENSKQEIYTSPFNSTMNYNDDNNYLKEEKKNESIIKEKKEEFSKNIVNISNDFSEKDKNEYQINYSLKNNDINEKKNIFENKNEGKIETSKIDALFEEVKNEKNESIILSKREKKLEDKIKELESTLDKKIDFLKYATTSLILTNNDIKNEIDNNPSDINKEEASEDIYQKYSLLKKPELSDITKAYLNSYTSPITHTELSDFSKAYISSNIIGGGNNSRPELSNLTMEYLKQNGTDLNNEDK